MAIPQIRPGASVDPKYKDFSIIDYAYTHIDDQPVDASILIPNNIKPGKTPVIVRWHGGGLVTGNRLFPDWLAPWLLTLATSTSAIIITPDHRLLPEHTGVDILTDLQTFFTHLLSPSTLPSLLPPHLKLNPDLSNLLITGESAGGYLALQSHLSPLDLPIAALILLYPMIDLHSAWFTTDDPERKFFNPPLPRMEEALLDDHVSDVKARREAEEKVVVSGRTPPDGVSLLAVMFQRGRFGEFFGTEEALFPIEVLEGREGKGRKVPPTWVIHGVEDSVVPVEGSKRLVEVVEGKGEGTPIRVDLVEGGDHGFDNHWESKEGGDWLSEGLEWLQKYWPVEA